MYIENINEILIKKFQVVGSRHRRKANLKRFYTEYKFNNEYYFFISDNLFDNCCIIKGKVRYLDGISEFFFNDDKRIKLFIQFEDFYLIKIGLNIYIFYNNDNLNYLDNFLFNCSNNRFFQIHKFLKSKKFIKIQKNFLMNFNIMKDLNFKNLNRYNYGYIIKKIEINDNLIISYILSFEKFSGFVYIYKKILLFKSYNNRFFLYKNVINEKIFYNFSIIVNEFEKIVNTFKNY